MQTAITFQAWAAAVVAQYPRAMLALDRTGEMQPGAWVAVRTVGAIQRIMEESLHGWFDPAQGCCGLWNKDGEWQEWAIAP